MVARLVHRLFVAAPAEHFAILRAARARLAKGGPRRARHSLPPVAFAALSIVQSLAAKPAARTKDATPKKVLHLLVAILMSVWSTFFHAQSCDN